MPHSIDIIFPPSRSVHSLAFPVDSLPQVPQSPYRPQHIANHPYAARSLAIDRWQKRPKSGRSSRTIDSQTAESITNAVIQIASKGSRAPLARLPEIDPVLSSREQENPSTKAPGKDGDANIAPSQSHIPRRIILDQAKFAEQFERKLPQKTRLSIRIDMDSPALQSWPSADSITPMSPRSPGSVVYGSDIIRVNPKSGAMDAMRRSSRTAGAVNGFRNSYLTSSPRETLLSCSARSTRRYSWSSMLPPSADLPVLYEAAGVTSKSEIIPRPRVPTFEEHMFENNLPFVSQPHTTSGLSSGARARAEPSGQRSSGIRGPRPPPSSPFQAGRRYLTAAQLMNDKYRRRRSGSLPIGNRPLNLGFGK
jgi:hypothetical protein